MRFRTVDLYWVAGFLEGEGYFYASPKHHGAIQVGACQVQREPLDRLAGFLGGRFHRKLYEPKARDQWAWTLGGSSAVGLMQTVYALMSPKRQEQIRKALGTWRTWGVNNKHKHLCKRGHLLSGDNLMSHPLGRRRCRACARVKWAEFASRKRRERGPVRQMSKITGEQATEIRRRVAAGEKQSAMAREFGISPVSVSHLILRRRWKNVD